ncbi:MAG: TonB-dependent receptor plug domain-containing protein, partial [Opitutales bacterium]
MGGHQLVSTVVHFSLTASLLLNAKEEAIELAPLSITAARLQENTRNIEGFPANITVITHKDFELSPAGSVAEILRQHTGITTPDNVGTGSFATIRMRGFGEKPAVAILVDGVRVEDSGTSDASLIDLPLSEIERIEIIRGGSSVNYGEGAIAGAINIITKSSDKKIPHGSMGGEIGSYGHHKERLSGGGMNGNFAYRASIVHEKWDGWRDYSGHEAWLFSLKPKYIFDTGRLTLNLRHSEIVDENPGALDLGTWSTNPRASNRTKQINYDSKQTHTSLSWVSDPSDATVVIAKVFGQCN